MPTASRLCYKRRLGEFRALNLSQRAFPGEPQKRLNEGLETGRSHPLAGAWIIVRFQVVVTSVRVA